MKLEGAEMKEVAMRRDQVASELKRPGLALILIMVVLSSCGDSASKGSLVVSAEQEQPVGAAVTSGVGGAPGEGLSRGVFASSLNPYGKPRSGIEVYPHTDEYYDSMRHLAESEFRRQQALTPDEIDRETVEEARKSGIERKDMGVSAPALPQHDLRGRLTAYGSDVPADFALLVAPNDAIWQCHTELLLTSTGGLLRCDGVPVNRSKAGHALFGDFDACEWDLAGPIGFVEVIHAKSGSELRLTDSAGGRFVARATGNGVVLFKTDDNWKPSGRQQPIKPAAATVLFPVAR